jgi:beta-galactosidase
VLGLIVVNGLALALWHGAGGDDGCVVTASTCDAAVGHLPIMTLVPPPATPSPTPTAPAAESPAPTPSATPGPAASSVPQPSGHATSSGAKSRDPGPRPRPAPKPKPKPPQVKPVSYVTRYLSDLPLTRAVNGWGPVERDRSNGGRAAGDGRRISIRGTTYTKGLGVHSDSHVQVALGGRCTRFAATIGIDDEVSADRRGRESQVVFAVVADGRLRYISPPLDRYSRAVTVNLDITGARSLDLIVDDLGDRDSDHADWAAARVTCRAD